MGEIDIIEGVNMVTQNKMGLHTLSGCMHVPGANQLGTNDNLDCNFQNATVGCGVTDTTNLATFGDGFNQAGGGVWATQFDVSGIFMWFWQRGNIPPELQGTAPQTLDISTWGAPVASYLSTSCDTSQFFGEQTLVLDITLCGDDAGGVNVYPQTCANEPPNVPNPVAPPPDVSECYFNNVVGPGSPRFDDAFFEINYLRSYSNLVGASPLPVPSDSSVPAPTSGPEPSSDPAATPAAGAPSTAGTSAPAAAGNNVAGTSDAPMRYNIASAYALTAVLAGALVI